MVNALEAILQYDVVDLYDHLSDFLNDMGALIGIPAATALESVNVTVRRPAVFEVSAALRARAMFADPASPCEAGGVS